MQVRTPARLPRLGVGNDVVPGHHEAKQAGLRHTRFAANTGANRILPRCRRLGSCGHCSVVYRVTLAGAPGEVRGWPAPPAVTAGGHRAVLRLLAGVCALDTMAFCHRAGKLRRRRVRGAFPEDSRGRVPGYASAAASAAFASAVEGDWRGEGADAVMAPSERMSIRQPVSRAASRAFCPSLPMASESW
jgi:hypothetical protein